MINMDSLQDKVDDHGADSYWEEEVHYKMSYIFHPPNVTGRRCQFWKAYILI